MQPRRLVLHNFGPFIHETIDFGEFEEGGLFLISGKTGAGKTTIFDSMTYALFGETTGQQRKGSEMRSLFASPDEMTSVSFTFEHQNYFYQIERSPEQILRKKRGEGTTTHGSKVSLTIFDAAMKEQRQLTKINEVDTFIKDLLQLDAKQFFQIILLPQGEFRNFLVASSSDKEKLLRNVFGTGMYQKLTDWLHEEQRVRGRELEKQSQQIQTLGEQYLWFDEAKLCPTLPEQLTVWSEDEALLNEWLAQKESLLQVLRTEVSTREQAFYTGKALDEQKRGYETRLLAFEQLEKEAPSIAEGKARLRFLQQLDKDQSLLKQIETSRLTQVEKKKALGQLDEEQKGLAEKQSLWEKQGSLFADQKTALQELLANQSHFQRLLPIANEIATNQAQNLSLSKELRIEEEEINAIALSLKAMEEERTTLKVKLQGQSALSQLEVALVKTKEQVQRWEENQLAWEKVTRNLAKKETIVAENQERLLEKDGLQTEKENFFKQLQSDYAKRQIVHWQSKLLPGEPCLICGSKEHPLLEEGGRLDEVADLITEEALQLAEKSWQVAREAYLAEKQQLEQGLFEVRHLKEQQQLLETTKEKLQKLLEQELVVTKEVSPLEAYHQAWADFQAQEEGFKKIAEKLSELEETTTTQRKSKEALLENKQTKEKEQLQLQGQLVVLEKQVQGLSLEELTNQVNNLGQEIQVIETELTAYETEGRALVQEDLILTERKSAWALELKKIEEQLTLQTVELEGKLASYPPESNERLLRESLVELEELPSLTKKISTYEEEWKILHHRLLEEANLKVLPWPDLIQLEADYETLRSQAETLNEEVLQKKHQAERNVLLIQQMTKLWKKNQVALEELGELQHLSGTFRGDNPAKLSLERYILQSFLQEVLEVANQRLIKLTRGRYQFLLAEEKGSYRNSTGLEINIYDDNAGTSRRSQTLSGGESFIAALALALSLADVIQQQSGGVAIEALFIDEGFGSLDEESLEMALEALEMIEQEGRLIGIISHVRELKDRVVQQLIVETNGAGQSQTRTKIG